MNGFLRPDVTAALIRWREVAGAAGVVGAGAFVFTFGGWFFQGVGLALALVGLMSGVMAYRRMRFHRAVEQPGIVEVVEGQVRYFGPEGGGFIAVPDLLELELVPDRAGQSWWRLTEAGGGILAVPVTAQGADQLFDTFSGLPGASQARLVAALDRTVGGPITVWRREGRQALT